MQDGWNILKLCFNMEDIFGKITKGLEQNLPEFCKDSM